jgi:hypothetical protein
MASTIRPKPPQRSLGIPTTSAMRPMSTQHTTSSHPMPPPWEGVCSSMFQLSCDTTRCVFSLPFPPTFIDLAREPSARRIIPRHPNATSTPQQGGSAPTPPYNSRMISAVRQSRTTPRRLAAIHSQPRSGPDHVMLDSSLPVDSSMPRSTER